MKKLFEFIDRFIITFLLLIPLTVIVALLFMVDFLRRVFDPSYTESDYERITRQQNARLEFDKRNIYPNKHTTHYCCDEIIKLHGGKAKGCCCTGHKCKHG